MKRFMRIGVTVFLALALTGLGDAGQQPRLQDQTGARFTFASLRGVPLVVTFVAAHCRDACPLVNAQFAMAQREIAAQRLRVVLLTITLDPAHDSPATMRRLARTFGADPRYWKVASGSVGDVRSVMQAFGVVAQPGRDGYAEAHTTFVYFIDAHGVLRKTILASYDLGTQLVEQLHQNWRALAS